MDSPTAAVFLDRDGVINRLITERGPRETPVTPEELQLLPGVTDALMSLRKAGFILVVATNQPNVAKGRTSLEEHNAIEQRLHQLVDGVIERVYTCLHHPDPTQVVRDEFLADCNCRKPRPGLLLQAKHELSLDMERSWFIGDNDTDIQAGLAAGLPADQLIFIGAATTLTQVVKPSLWEATLHILQEVNYETLR